MRAPRSTKASRNRVLAASWLALLLIVACPITEAAKSSGRPFLSPKRLDFRGGSDPPAPVVVEKPINFHKHKPPVPVQYATLEEVEATATDEMISGAIDQVTLGSKYSSSIILPYKPERAWLWKRWYGTILQSSLSKVGINTAVTLVLSLFLRRFCGNSWKLGVEPSADCLLVARLKAVDKLWHYQMTLTTFILTFFLGQAYQTWREMYKVGRSIQGRLSDVGVLLATHAVRDDRSRTYTPTSSAFLSTTSRHLRLFHILTWAASSRQFQVLLTNRGLTQLMEREFMTPEELTTLLQLPMPPSQRANAVIEWLIVESDQARRAGILQDASHYPKVLLQKICDLRGTAASIGDLVSGRMPLAYTHLVQLLVDSFLFLAPLALYTELGIWSVVCVALLTLFYEGLLDLAKIFLDPLNNEDYCEGGVDMDLGVFIRESNAGTLKWAQGLAVLPSDMVMAGDSSEKTAPSDAGQPAPETSPQ